MMIARPRYYQPTPSGVHDMQSARNCGPFSIHATAQSKTLTPPQYHLLERRLWVRFVVVGERY